jgi:hypothetical protein
VTQLLAHLVGDYLLQSDWMANNKTKRSWPALVHALLYSLCFVPMLWTTPSTRMVENPKHTPIECGMKILSGEPCITYVAANGDEYLDGKLIRAGYIPVTVPSQFRWLPWLVIFSTHFLIDRFRLARYVVWAKNWIAPISNVDYMGTHDLFGQPWYRWEDCQPTGYFTKQDNPNATPMWMATWLLIIADNTCHLAINYAALKWL